MSTAGAWARPGTSGLPLASPARGWAPTEPRRLSQACEGGSLNTESGGDGGGTVVGVHPVHIKGPGLMAFSFSLPQTFETVKVVEFKHRPLAIIHLVARAGIVLWIVVWHVLVQRGYQRLETPFLRVHAADVKAPPDDAEGALPPYCTGKELSAVFDPRDVILYSGRRVGAAPSPRGAHPLPCIAWEAEDIAHFDPAVGLDIATRMNVTRTRFNARCQGLFDEGCAPLWLPQGAPDAVFTRRPEAYTVGLGMEASAFGGAVRFASGGVAGRTEPVPIYGEGGMPVGHASPIGDRDVLPVAALLRAAGMPGLDLSGHVLGSDQSARWAGATVRVSVNFRPSAAAGYFYTAELVALHNLRTEYVHVGAPKGLAERLVLHVHSLRLVFDAAGAVGRFDWETLAVSLLGGVALLGAATTLTELALLYVLPLRRAYRLFKYAPVPDLGLLDAPTGAKEREAVARAVERRRRKHSAIPPSASEGDLLAMARERPRSVHPYPHGEGVGVHGGPAAKGLRRPSSPWWARRKKAGGRPHHGPTGEPRPRGAAAAASELV